MEKIEAGPLEFHDKIKLKTGYEKLGVRVVLMQLLDLDPF